MPSIHSNFPSHHPICVPFGNCNASNVYFQHIYPYFVYPSTTADEDDGDDDARDL